MTRAGPDGSADGGGGGVGGVHDRGLRTRVYLKSGRGDDKGHPRQDVSLCPILEWGGGTDPQHYGGLRLPPLLPPRAGDFPRPSGSLQAI